MLFRDPRRLSEDVANGGGLGFVSFRNGGPPHGSREGLQGLIWFPWRREGDMSRLERFSEV